MKSRVKLLAESLIFGTILVGSVVAAMWITYPPY